MLDFSRFSDLFAQFTPGFKPGNLFGTKSPALPLKGAVQDVPKAPEDILDISGIRSNLPSASFDRTGEEAVAPPPVAVAESGIYRPTQIQHQLGTSLNFSMSLSLQKATVIQRPAQTQQSLSRETTAAQFGYQSQFVSQETGGSYRELRQFQTSLFYNRTRSLSQTLSPETGQHLESTGRKVARRFEIEISMDFSFLRQYNIQTESLSEDEALMGQYLTDVDGLAARSGEALKAFFDEVDAILADTEGFVKETLGGFLSDVQAAFDLNNTEAEAFVSMIADEVDAFFDEVGLFLDEARAALATPEIEAAEAELALV